MRDCKATDFCVDVNSKKPVFTVCSKDTVWFDKAGMAGGQM